MTGNQNENYSQRPENEDENGAGGRLGAEDEREKANDGDWDSLRGHTRTDESGNYGDSDDNPGGAGSTGSEATNSGNSQSL